MVTLHLMCGLPGAGKTTRARELELEHRAVRLSPDDWISAVLGPDPGDRALDAARDPTEALQWELAARLLALGIDVILDFGFWSCEERETYRDRAAALGASSVVHFIDTKPELLRERLARRRVDRPASTYLVSDPQLADWSALFQRPTPEELIPRAAS